MTAAAHSIQQHLTASLQSIGVAVESSPGLLEDLHKEDHNPLDQALADAALVVVDATGGMLDPTRLEELSLRHGKSLLLIGRDEWSDLESLVERVESSYRKSQTTRAQFQWTAIGAPDINGAQIRYFQGMPVDHLDQETSNLVMLATTRILRLSEIVRAEPGRSAQIYWPSGERSLFNRLHETTSALYALGQLGLPKDNPLMSHAIAGLADADPADVQDRAAIAYLISLGLLPQEKIVAFCRMLAAYRGADPLLDDFGSVVLPQGDPPPGGQQHWERPLHPGGAAFHACHLSEALLCVPREMPMARAMAADLLRGFRACLENQFDRHDGWVVRRDGRRGIQTLYAYAVAPQLGLALPANWVSVTKQCLEIAEGEGFFEQVLTILNICYMAQVLDTDESTNMAIEYVDRTFPSVGAEFERTPPRVVSDALFLRALVYLTLLTQPERGRIVHAAAWRAIRDWIGEIE